MALIEQPIEETEAYELVDVPDDEQETELSGVLAELGVDSLDDILLKVYRINEMGKEAHCFDTLPDGLNGIEDRLRDAYGKGDYKIKVFAPTPQGRKSIKKQVKLSIETPLEKDAPIVDTNDDLKTVMSTMMEAMAQNQTNMVAMLQNSQLESQLKMQEMLITIMGGKKDEPTLLETMQLLKSLQPDQKDPMEVLKTMMDVQSTMKEMVEPAETGTMGELTKGLNSLVSLAANAPKPQPGQPAEVPAPAARPSLPPQPQTTATGEDMNPLINMKLRQHLAMLIQKAQAGKNPEAYAYVTIEEIPQQFYPVLLENLGDNNEHALSKLSAIEPGIMQYPEWFGQFCDEIRASFAEVQQELDETGLTDDDKTGDDTQNPGLTIDADKQPEQATSANESDA